MEHAKLPRMSKSACHEGTTGQDLSPSRCFQRSYEPHLVACHTVNPKNSKLPTEKLTAGIRENQTVPVIRIKIAGNYHKMLMDVMYIYIIDMISMHLHPSMHEKPYVCAQVQTFVLYFLILSDLFFTWQ